MKILAERLQRCSSGGTIDRELTTRYDVRVHVTENDVGVRHGRFSPTVAVTDGTWVSAGTARPDPQDTPIVPSDTAAACTDLNDVERRRANGVALFLESASRHRRRADFPALAF